MQRIAIDGYSAGANLSAATNLHLGAFNKPVLTVQRLNDGSYDRPRPESDSYVRYNGPKYRLTLAEVFFLEELYEG